MPGGTPGGRVRGRGRATAVACLIAGIALAGCGSSNSSTTKPSGSAGTVTGSPAASHSGATVAAAAKVVAQYEKLETTIPQQTPLKTKPPTGKTFVYAQCEEFSTCKIIGNAAVAAAQAVGWNAKVLSYSSNNPATLVAALKQALLYKPAAVALTGLPEAVWSSVIPAYRQAGVPIITAQVGPQPIGKTVIANIYTPQDAAIDAKILANWMVVDSGGKGSAVVENVPGFPVLGAFTPAFKQALAAACAACSMSSVNATIQQVSSASASNQVMTSALQRDPSAKYAVSTDMLLNAGLPAALQASGLSGVKVIGALATPEAEQQMLAGRESAMTAQPYQYQGWLIIDAALRHIEGMPITAGDGGVPHQLLLKSNVGQPAPVSGQPPNFEAQFKRLWKLG